MKLRTVLLTAAAFGLSACTPAAEEAPPAAPDPAPIAAEGAPSGPAAENTPDSLASAPAADPAATTPAPAPAPSASASSSSSSSSASPPSPPTPEELANGRTIYAGAGSCALCHGPAGQGTPMGVALTAGLEYAAIKEKITKGMVNPGDKMPPMGAALSAEQLDDLSKFVEAGLPQ